MGTDAPKPLDDEAQLARYAGELADAIDSAIVSWVLRCVATRIAGHHEQAAAVAERVRLEVSPELRALLGADIDHQRATPLQVLRRSTAPVNALLADLGAPEPARDEVSHRLDPTDTYDLGPAAFADLGPEVAAAGVCWGAAKAHVHRSRHRR